MNIRLIMLVAVLGIVGMLLVFAVRPREHLLEISFLNVGQGDAIFIQTPSGKQMLIDGGPDREVLRQLGEVMPWYDKSIDIVLVTHPDADHVSGLIDVLQRYTVDLIVEPGVKHDTPQAESLLRSVAGEGAQEIIARRGQILHFQDGVRFEVLFPDRDVSDVETNTASIVGKLVYGSTSVMLTGDTPAAIEEYLVMLDAEGLDAEILKAAHHGSKTSSSKMFVDAVSPIYTVFSRGCDNSYGHPSKEVVARFASAALATLDTCADGRITFVSDGVTMQRR